MTDTTHNERILTVEARTEALEKWTEDFGDRYDKDRAENRDNFHRIFKGIETISAQVSANEASKGRVSMSMVICVVLGLPSIIVPVCVLGYFSITQTVNPIQMLIEQDHAELMRQREVQVELLVEQGRQDERLKFLEAK